MAPINRRAFAAGLAGTAAAAGWMRPARAAEAVSLLLPAPPALPGFGAFVLAKANGYYEADGFDVTFQIAPGGVEVAKQTGVGNALIGECVGDTPMIVRANGVPVRALAILGGGGLTQIAIPQASPLKSPADFKGKSVGVQAFQDTTYYALLGVLAKVGLTKNDVDIQALGVAGVWQALAAGKVAAMAGTPDACYFAKKAGAALRITSADLYFPSMAPAIIASDTSIREKPDALRKMVRSTLRAFKDILGDPKRAAADFLKATPSLIGHEDDISGVFTAYLENVWGGQKKLGSIDVPRMKAVQDFYVKSGIIGSAVPVDQLYTEQFL